VLNFRFSADWIWELANTGTSQLGAPCSFTTACADQRFWVISAQGEIDYIESVLGSKNKASFEYVALLSSLNRFRVGRIEDILRYCNLDEKQIALLSNSVKWSLEQESWQENLPKLEKWAKELSVAGF
jgi:hypothetical protein